jgi:hypothetical protein
VIIARYIKGGEVEPILNFSEVQRRLSIYFRFWKRGGGFKEDDAVWAEPKMPQNTGLPELKALNPDHCFVAALGTGICSRRQRFLTISTIVLSQL